METVKKHEWVKLPASEHVKQCPHCGTVKIISILKFSGRRRISYFDKEAYPIGKAPSCITRLINAPANRYK